jgi:hypothetical protein
MSENIRSLAKEHHAFYQVLPYYLVLDESHGRIPARTRRVHAGYDVDIFGARTDANAPIMPPPEKYAPAYAELQRMAAEVSQDAAGACSVEVIAFPATAVIDAKGQGKVGALLRVRISHLGGLDQPAGLPERRALQEMEERLEASGIARR